MNKNPLISKYSLIYEIILFVLYIGFSLLAYVVFHKDLEKTVNLIAIGAFINLVIFLISLKPITGKISKDEKKTLNMNSTGVQMTRRIFRFFITVLNTIITIFFIGIVVATSMGRFL